MGFDVRLLVVLAAAGLGGCASSQVLVRIDHETGHATWGSGKDTNKVLRDGHAVKIKEQDSLLVRVFNTNTATYSFDLKQERTVAPEMAAARMFLADFKPYFAELGQIVESGRGDFTIEQIDLGIAATNLLHLVDRAKQLGDSLLATMDTIARITDGPAGFATLQLIALSSLHHMDRSEVESNAKAGRDSLARIWRTYLGDTRAAALSRMVDDSSHRLAYAEILTQLFLRIADLRPSVASHVDSLTKKLPELRGTPKTKVEALIKYLKETETQAAKVFADLDKFLATAYQVEALVIPVLIARSTWTSDPIRVTRDSSVNVSVAIAKSASQPLQRQATLKLSSFRVKVDPDWLIRPAVGVSFLMSRFSRFSTFGTKDTTGGVKIVTPGEQDSRFTWGVSLSLTARAVDCRASTGLAWWPLELTINPSDNVRAIGVGMAVSASFFKFGGGMLWTKHTELNGQNVGDVLPDSGSLKTRETYGRGEWYVGVSLVGWAPFAK